MRGQLGEVSTSRLLDGGRLFRLSGEFDLSNSWKIKDAILPAMRGGRDIVVDLTEVRFFDTQLVRVVVKARLAAVRRGQGFKVIPPPDQREHWRVAEAGELRLAA